MRRMLILSLLVVGAAVALGIGSYSALAGAGPVSSVAGAVVGAEEPDDGDVVGDTVDAGNEDGDDDDGVVAQQDGEGAPEMVGAEVITEAIGEQFGVDAETVLEQHGDDVGFGALFKLYALAAVMEGTTVQDLLVTNGNGDYEFNFGELRKDLTPEQQAALDSGPKNLGKLVSAAHHEDNGGAGGVTGQGAGQGHAFGRGHGQGKPDGVPANGDSEDDGDGPPDHAPAHGRR